MKLDYEKPEFEIIEIDDEAIMKSPEPEHDNNYSDFGDWNDNL